jgi:hypothetical protein
MTATTADGTTITCTDLADDRPVEPSITVSVKVYVLPTLREYGASLYE